MNFLFWISCFAFGGLRTLKAAPESLHPQDVHRIFSDDEISFINDTEKCRSSKNLNRSETSPLTVSSALSGGDITLDLGVQRFLKKSSTDLGYVIKTPDKNIRRLLVFIEKGDTTSKNDLSKRAQIVYLHAYKWQANLPGASPTVRWDITSGQPSGIYTVNVCAIDLNENIVIAKEIFAVVNEISEPIATPTPSPSPSPSSHKGKNNLRLKMNE